MYREGVFITEIAARTGFGASTIFRWAKETGIVQSFSERLAAGSGSRQFGREVIGKKGAFHTTKGGAWIHTDSTYEYARLQQLERVAGIVRIDRCRDRIRYRFGGRDRTYIPDFEIQFSDGTVIVEGVKPARWVTDPKVRAKVDAAHAFYAESGRIFRVITENDIGLDEIRFAATCLVSRQDPAHTEAVRERRRRQRAETQKRYMQRLKATATSEELAAIRAKAAAFQRKYRAQKRKNLAG